MLLFFFFSNVVRIYVFKRKEWRGGNGIGIHSTCMYKSVFKWYTTNLFCWTCSRVCNQKWLGLAKSWFTRPKVNPRQANRILSHAKPVTLFPLFTSPSTPSRVNFLYHALKICQSSFRDDIHHLEDCSFILSLLIKHSPCPLTGIRHQPEKK